MEKHPYLSNISLLFFTVIFLAFTGCQQNNPPPSNSNNQPTNWDMTAKLTFDNGQVVNFHCNFTPTPYFNPIMTPGDSATYIFVPGSSSQMNLAILGNITGAGDYHYTDWPEDGDIGGNIDLNTGNEHYMNYEGNPNPATLHVISFANHHIKATFSGKLYQDGGNKIVTVENGKLDADLTVDMDPDDY